MDGESARKTLTVRQVKSANGRLKRHKACLAGLGLRRIGHVVEVEDTPAVRGMVARVRYLLEVQETDAANGNGAGEDGRTETAASDGATG